MPRYYAIKIDGAPNPPFKEVPGSPVPGAQFSSVADVGLGPQNDPGALRCMMRIEMVDSSAVTMGSFVRLYGVDVKMLQQASDLNGKSIEIHGGFWSPGLPLANEEAEFAGPLYCGTIYQAYGNWEDTDMTLDLLLQVGNQVAGGNAAPTNPGGSTSGAESGSGATPQRFLTRQRSIAPLRSARGLQPVPRPTDMTGDALGGISSVFNEIQALASSFGGGGWLSTPANLIHNWQQGEPLSNSIRRTLTQAFPWCTVDIQISDALKTTMHDVGFYQSLEQFMGFAKQTSLSIMGSNKSGNASGGIPGAISSILGGLTNPSQQYKGIHTYTKCQNITITDYTGEHPGPSLRFEELIGQPTWVGPDEINFKTPMRADLFPPMDVTLPPNTLQFVQPGQGNIVPLVAPSMSITFQGSAKLKKMLIVGDSRHPDGAAWACVYWAYLPAGGQSINPGGSTSGAESGTGATPSGSLMGRRIQRYGNRTIR